MEAIILELLACQRYDFAPASILTLNNMWSQCGTLLYVSLCKMWQLCERDYWTSWLSNFLFWHFLSNTVSHVMCGIGYVFSQVSASLIITNRNKWSKSIKLVHWHGFVSYSGFYGLSCLFYFNHVKLDGTWWCLCLRNLKP